MIIIFQLMNKGIGIMNNLIFIIISLALVGFLWGIVKIVFNRGNEKVREEGRKFMLYGILTLFVMTSVWAIVYFLKGFLGTDYIGDINYTPDSIDNSGTLPLDNAGDLFNNNADQGMI